MANQGKGPPTQQSDNVKKSGPAAGQKNPKSTGQKNPGGKGRAKAKKSY